MKANASGRSGPTANGARRKLPGIRLRRERPDDQATPKRSAERVAALRFGASFEDDPQVRCPDRIVGSLLSWHIRALASIALARRAVLAHYRNAFPGIYEYHIARTHYIDRFVLREVANGAQQLVLLGAGFDTRPLRMQDALRRVRVLEVDHPPTSRHKQAQLARVGRIPQNVTFVPVDLEREKLLPALELAGYRTDLRTVFVWEGVSMFLTERAVTATLSAIAGAETDSAVVFDHILRSVADGHYQNAYGSREAALYLAAQGEPYTFGLEPDEVRPFLARHGLFLERWQPSRELAPHYLRRSDGQLLGQVNDFHAIAVARPAQKIAVS